MAYISDFATIYNAKCKLSSQQLSLLTPFIKIRPMFHSVGTSNDTIQANKFIKQSVNQLQITQDSDVIVFNKIVASVQFVPDSLKNKLNFMDDINIIFNQGSPWIISCGWTGPQSLVSAQQTYVTQRTLLKTNIKLVGNKYVGTMQFCGVLQPNWP